ncbi:MAG TPA: PQQ-binding-like beta-propeller repeat protein [Solirubrobacteraceae bacterium]|nr:PQQ-binding-like beta-propeller repeat protein [Solirubrobacteraceae bacterium]
MSSLLKRLLRRRLLVAAAVALLVLAGGGLAAFALLRGNTGNVSHPNASFQPEAPSKPPARSARDRFVWPTYGYTPERRHYFPAPASFGPPFTERWSRAGRTLIEFPPAISGRTLYVLNNFGLMQAINADTGRRRWHRKLGLVSASSPAVGGNTVYATILQHHKAGAGRVVAVSARNGHIRWSRPLRGRSESSPLLDHGSLYFGSENGTVYALRARNGSTRWTFKASGAVKGGPALSNGVLYFGDYGGKVHAVRASNGHTVWTAKTKGAHFGFSAGQFYSSPAVAFGRVYLGNTDGRVYSFTVHNGQLAWARQTGNYVYASPAVAQISSYGPTVYEGSYDGTFYALDARSGRVRWKRRTGGKISGSATIVGDVVYFANLARRSTLGLSVRTGRQVFSYSQGGFNPVVTDGHAIYLIGYSTIAALTPKSAKPPRAGAATRRHKHKHRRHKRHKRHHQRHR